MCDGRGSSLIYTHMLFEPKWDLGLVCQVIILVVRYHVHSEPTTIEKEHLECGGSLRRQSLKLLDDHNWYLGNNCRTRIVLRGGESLMSPSQLCHPD